MNVMESPISIMITSFDEVQADSEDQILQGNVKGKIIADRFATECIMLKSDSRNENKLPLSRSYSSPPGNGRRPLVNKSYLKVPRVSSNFQDANKMHKTKVVSMGTKDKIGNGDNNTVTYYPNRKFSDSWIGSTGVEITDKAPAPPPVDLPVEKERRKESSKNSINSSIANHFQKRPKLNLKKLDLDRKFISTLGNKISNGSKHKDQNNNYTTNNNSTQHGHKKQVVEKTMDDFKSQHEKQETIIREMIQDFFTKNLEGLEYNHETNEDQSIHLSQKIHDYLKQMTNEEFKFIVSVFIGEIRDEGMETSSQCVWDPKQDYVIMGYYRNDSLFAIAVVFAIALD